MFKESKFLIVIAGPTAVGKTAAAIKVAQHFDAEILSADSRQFYKELNIGVARPSPEELNTVKHHFIASLSIQGNYSAGQYEQDALELLNHIYKEKDIAILVGGSGLFINAVCHGFDEYPDIDSSIREKYNGIYEKEGLEYIQAQLKEKDPEYFEQIDLGNPRRILRALETIEVSGKPFSSLQNSKTVKRSFEIIKIGLEMDREVLYHRINQRVDQMVHDGLVEEVKSLIKFKDLNALNTVGYKELFDHFGGKASLEEAIAMIKQNSRRYAKRQLTWFRRDEEVNWFKPESIDSIIEFVLERVKV